MRFDSPCNLHVILQCILDALQALTVMSQRELDICVPHITIANIASDGIQLGRECKEGMSNN